MCVSPKPAHGVCSDLRPEALLQLDGESERRRKHGAGTASDSHNPFATHSPMRGMSKGFNERQESSSQQATPAPCGRHSLCTKVQNEEVFPLPTKGRCSGEISTFPSAISRGAGNWIFGILSRNGIDAVTVSPIDIHLLGHPSR